MSTVLFVGGPRHGKTVNAEIQDEKEMYRVPALSKDDDPVEYRSTKLILTFPNPITKQPDGETWHAWVYVLPELYPDNPQAIQQLQAGMQDATMRHYLYQCGERTSGGPAAVAVADKPAFVAWCPDCLAIVHPEVLPEDTDYWPNEVEFVDVKSRANRMAQHIQTTGHKPVFDNRKG